MINRLSVFLTATLLLGACSSPAPAEPVSYKVSDVKSDITFEYSRGDKKKVEQASTTVDIISAEILVSVDSMTASITLAELPEYVAPTTFQADAIIDRVYYYYFYFDKIGRAHV